MAPLVAFCAFDPLFTASVSSIWPWTEQVLSVKIEISFIGFCEIGLLTVFGV
jgi:hypothetical protein